MVRKFTSLLVKMSSWKFQNIRQYISFTTPQKCTQNSRKITARQQTQFSMLSVMKLTFMVLVSSDIVLVNCQLNG